MMTTRGQGRGGLETMTTSRCSGIFKDCGLMLQT